MARSAAADPQPACPDGNVASPAMMAHPSRAAIACLLAAAGAALAGGCAQIETRGKTPLAPVRLSPGSVSLETAFVRFTYGDPEINRTLWSEIDELQLPPDLRRRLAANGFRAGLIGGQLPAALERLMQPGQAPAPTSAEANVADLVHEPVVRSRRLQVREGQAPAPRIIVTGEQQPHPELTVLVRSDVGEVNGRSFHAARGLFTVSVFPLADGRVRVELLPEVEHGEPRKQFVLQGEGYAKLEFRPATEVFSDLRLAATLAPGQILVVGPWPDRPGTLGHHYLSEPLSGPTVQKLLLVRLAQTQHDDLFGLGGYASSPSNRIALPR